MQFIFLFRIRCVDNFNISKTQKTLFFLHSSGEVDSSRRLNGQSLLRLLLAVGGRILVLSFSLTFLDGVGVDGDGFGRVVSLVDAHKPIGQLKHVGTKGDDDELSVARSLLLIRNKDHF